MRIADDAAVVLSVRFETASFILVGPVWPQKRKRTNLVRRRETLRPSLRAFRSDSNYANMVLT